MQEDNEIVPINEEVKKTQNKFNLLNMGRFVKNAMEVFEEGIQGCSIAYGNYVILAYDPQLESRLGYGFVIAGGLAGGITEVLSINKVISDKKHHYYRLIKEALAGASVAAIYTESLLDPTASTVAVGGAVLVVLTTSKALIEIFNKKQFMHSKVGRVIEYGVGGIYNVLMAAGIADYLFSICEGFGAEIHPAINYSVTAGLSIANLLADLPIAKVSKQQHLLTPETKKEICYKNFCYRPAHGFRSFLYASEISLFLTIFVFDVITDIRHNTRITDAVFYSVLACTMLEGGIAMTRKLRADNKEAQQEEAESNEEIRPLIKHKKEENKKTSYFSLKTVTNCYQSFWKFCTSHDEEMEKIEAFVSKKKGSKCNFPSISWFKDCIKAKKETKISSSSDYDDLLDAPGNSEEKPAMVV